MKIKIFGGHTDTMEEEVNAFLAESGIDVLRMEVSEGKVFIFYREVEFE